MPADAMTAYRVLRGRLGREPSFTELLHVVAGPQAGEPALGVQAPGYPAHPEVPSMLLGPVEADAGLSALLEERSLLESYPELSKMREELIKELLFGGLCGHGGGAGGLMDLLQSNSRSPGSGPGGAGLPLGGGHTRPGGGITPDDP